MASSPHPAPNRPIVVGLTGASGAWYGVRTLEALRELGIPTHLILTKPGAQVLEHETGLSVDEVKDKATKHWIAESDRALFAPTASGSFLTGGMVVAPCSIRTLSAVACARSSNLLERAADVTLKEGRPLILLVRETPLHGGHLRLMLQAAEMGATILPPMPAFYRRPTSIEELVDHVVGRTLDHLGLEHDLVTRWGDDD